MKKKSIWKKIQWPSVAAGLVLGIGVGALFFRSSPPHRPPSSAVHRPVTPVEKTAAPVSPAPLRRNHAKVAIVLDDWGYSRKLMPLALQLGRPLTLAVLPHQPYSKIIAQTARGTACEVILHMPMEPYGEDSPREPQVLPSGAGRSTVRQMLDRALATVPYAKGVSNHQGSKATENPALMKLFLEELKSRRLFFLDSLVTDQSAGKEIARSVNVLFVQRSVFLDNVETREAIRQRLFELTEVALRKGAAVGIGHDKKVTLETLQQTMPEMERRGIEFVRVSELVSS
ncbi:MAG: divergent polysaccharide deacetylase family protein [Candidatus Omnitrophica bacterium]|nr:divergent polysaccharide deacetylase family protein [Candidatus Omnitrophota bacterium]